MIRDLDYPVMEKEKAGSELLWRQEDDKFILLARHDMYVLNEFSKEIFDMCDGTKTLQDLVNHCVSTYGVEENVVKEQIVKLINFAIEKLLMHVRKYDD